MTRQLGIAVIGCGYWGVNYIRLFSELPESRVVVACDRQIDRLREVGRRYPDLQSTTEVEDALGMEGVDAAIICTPATTHYSVACRCLDARKHILVEKPITTSSAEAKDLTALAESKRLSLMVGHTFLYNPAINKIKQYIAQGDVGRIYYLYARRTNLGPIRQDVNAVWDLASHDVSIFNYLLDSVPSWVSAVGANVLRNRRQDVGFISLGYRPDIVAHIHVSWADPNKVREVVVVGSEMRVVFNDLNPLEKVRIFEKAVSPVPAEASNYGEYQFQMRDGDIISPKVEAAEPLKVQCSHFVRCVAGGGVPATDGQQGLEVVRVMEGIDHSIACNGAPIDLEAPIDLLEPVSVQLAVGDRQWP